MANAQKKTELTKGDRVSWSTSQGATRGVVVRKAVRRFQIEDFQVEASAADPRYVVKSDKTGKIAAHRPGALRKLVSR